jgi:hypothetical protein
MVYNTVKLISEGVKNMQNILYKIINLLDDIVDSGNMIIAQYIFLLFTAISFFAAVTLSEGFFAVTIISVNIAALLWLYHRIVRSDSFY